MKKIFTLLVIAVAGYFAYQNFSQDNIIETLYEEPYVVVYGRDSCGWTHKYLKDLENENIDLFYEIIDDKEVEDELHSRMKEAGISTDLYNLPVIDVNGRILIRPDLNTILLAYEIETEQEE